VDGRGKNYDAFLLQLLAHLLFLLVTVAVVVDQVAVGLVVVKRIN
jgi:hypothetical protein